MIQKLILKNFRKFTDRTFEFDKNITIFYGSNAQGKSSVLEAIYLLANGKSPWAPTDEYINDEQNKQIHTRIESIEDNKSYVYFKDTNSRILKIEGKSVKSKTFFENRSATIFNPEKIELLMISSSQRRDFLDDTIQKYNYEYETLLKDFRKILRQRNAYLKRLSKLFYEQGIIAINDPQLNFWSKHFSLTSAYITQNRISLTKELSHKGYEVKYKTGFTFDKRKLGNTEYLQESIEQDLEKSKRRDIATGYTNIGPHRDDWSISKDRDIHKFGSRGEKRLAIGELIFQTQDTVFNKTSHYPVLLLDDIASELDIYNTKKIFEKKILDKQQTFITVIDYKTLPKEILKDSQLIHLNGQ
ncbi:MAG: recombination protein F, DNA replication and repair protein RecF [candidate division WS6 bacterium GW2011_GWC1_33_20]|uniref:DNA replication and repair protein RecF n=1 Tax=candidate division WS6 bacterium GW2011_GWC1_33_20 TaxID=1619089 RepID=A0A0G0CJR7_9BACT|nr:MAG: recombination protein F, DNA replication and repair protein RecF [candidate division WS6 bacterium GW2011_GWE2_33_157]KKP43667.1 MAG: recombination protein F, DNA replication and repair protein RecF [candidate division WS6 bacterium GW2011_GWC1_33_20]KKP45372.1 MAG: recombination protein F, DNA replication and repair protein RecF [candidate division WS6 bacterium GW2011_GWF1_33_233]KKP54700.1 MAG: recombination protein F, DNA replication and repair protein RecF [candidate division WS6 ba